MSSTATASDRGFCRSCRAHIIWARTLAGKVMPLDVALAMGGNIELDADGIARVVAPAPDVARHVSHFVSCPRAAAHRRPRG